MFKPYLYFDGNAEEAIALYKEAFGAQLHCLIRNKEVDPNSVNGELVNYAELAVSGSTLMLQDLPGATPGRNYYLDILGSPDYLRKV